MTTERGRTCRPRFAQESIAAGMVGTDRFCGCLTKEQQCEGAPWKRLGENSPSACSLQISEDKCLSKVLLLGTRRSHFYLKSFQAFCMFLSSLRLTLCFSMCFFPHRHVTRSSYLSYPMLFSQSRNALNRTSVSRPRRRPVTTRRVESLRS